MCFEQACKWVSPTRFDLLDWLSSLHRLMTSCVGDGCGDVMGSAMVIPGAGVKFVAKSDMTVTSVGGVDGDMTGRVKTSPPRHWLGSMEK